MAAKKKPAAKADEKAEAGRPTDYQDEYAAQAEKLCELGATDNEIAEFFEVDRSTIYRWKHRYPDFCDAIKSGKVLADKRVERSLYQKAVGYDVTEQQAIKIRTGQYTEEVEVVEVRKHVPAETAAAFIWLKNRQPESWRDKVELATATRPGQGEVTDTDRAKGVAVLLAKQEALPNKLN